MLIECARHADILRIETHNGEGWTEVARYLKQFGMTSEQTEQCRELSVKSLTENKKLDDVNEKLYESISYPVIAGI